MQTHINQQEKYVEDIEPNYCIMAIEQLMSDTENIAEKYQGRKP